MIQIKMQDNKLQDLSKKIESIFNFDQESDEVKPPSTFVESLSAFENKSNQLLNIPRSDITTIEEKEYIDVAFKTMIDLGMEAFKTIVKTIKVGTPGKDLEGYSRFFDSLSMTLERLIGYKMKIREIELMNNIEKQPTQNIQNNFFTGETTSNDLLDKVNEMIKSAKKDSQLNEIEAKFHLGPEPKQEDV